MTTDKHDQPEAAPPVVGREEFDAALAEQVAQEKEVTRHGDRVSAARRRLPMVEVENYTFAGPDGAVTLVDLFGKKGTSSSSRTLCSTRAGTRAARAAPGQWTTCRTT